MTKNRDLYKVSVNRKDLDTLIEHFANAGLAEMHSDPDGSIVFEIKKGSSLNIKPYDPCDKLKKEIKKLKLKYRSLKQERAKNALANKINIYESVLKMIC